MDYYPTAPTIESMSDTETKLDADTKFVPGISTVKDGRGTKGCMDKKHVDHVKGGEKTNGFWRRCWAFKQKLCVDTALVMAIYLGSVSFNT